MVQDLSRCLLIYFILCFPILSTYGSELFMSAAAPHNQSILFQYRVPTNYAPDLLYTILILFGGRNTDGKADASGRMGWGKWCDENNVFILAPGFKDDNYWEPGTWSGQALLNALAELKKNYNVDTEHLLYYGYSAGSQESNLFAARYVISRRFVRDYRSMGVEILWKTLPNHRHEVPMSSLELARAFLGYHLKHHRQRGRAAKTKEETVSYPFVGNDLTGDYYPANSPKVQAIQEEERVKLPDRKIAEAWRKAAE